MKKTKDFTSVKTKSAATLTPYAVLLARPADSDETIRRLYHNIARYTHPDAIARFPEPGRSKAREEWYRATEAYTAIKTEPVRRALELTTNRLSGVCTACRGFGVKGSRLGGAKVRICEACKGEGRVKR